MQEADSVLSTPPINTSALPDEKPGAQAPESPQCAFYIPTDVTPFQAIGRLRKEARDEINRLIGFLDKTDDYVSRELEDDVSADQEAGNDDEPSLGFLDGMTDQTRINEGIGNDIEDEHDGSEPSLGSGDGRDLEADYADDEPSLGWPEAFGQGLGSMGAFGLNDGEVSPPVVTAAAQVRHKRADRNVAKGDGMHVDSEHGFGRRRIRNLSERQRNLVSPKVDHSEVGC